MRISDWSSDVCSSDLDSSCKQGQAGDRCACPTGSLNAQTLINSHQLTKGSTFLRPTNFFSGNTPPKTLGRFTDKPGLPRPEHDAEDVRRGVPRGRNPLTRRAASVRDARSSPRMAHCLRGTNCARDGDTHAVSAGPPPSALL